MVFLVSEQLQVWDISVHRPVFPASVQSLLHPTVQLLWGLPVCLASTVNRFLGVTSRLYKNIPLHTGWFYPLMTFNINFVWNIPLKKTSSHSRKQQMVEDFLVVSFSNFPLKLLICVNLKSGICLASSFSHFFPHFYWIKELLGSGLLCTMIVISVS